MKVVLSIIVLHMFIGAITGMATIFKRSFKYDSNIYNAIKNVIKKPYYFTMSCFSKK